MTRVGIAVLAVLLLRPADDAAAFEALEGWLIAQSACPASPSLRGDADTTLEPGRAYPMLGGNRPSPSHYQVRIEAGNDRWVAVSCGVHVVPAGAPTAPAPSRDLVLAVSWQPAFCEGHASKPECASQTAGRFDATHFSLHGLWPQPMGNAYCGVPAAEADLSRRGDWGRLPAPALDAAVRAELATVMPGAASFLDRHEWTRHGTCYGGSADAYFGDALALVRQLNASAVADLFAGSIGLDLSAGTVRDAFDAAFGDGAGRRVSIACESDGARRLVVELRISLSGRPGPDAGLRELVAAAPEAPAGCAGGIVDPAGHQ